MSNRERVSGAQVLHDLWMDAGEETDARDFLDDFTRDLLGKYEAQTRPAARARDEAPFEEMLMGRDVSRTKTHETVGKRGRRSPLPESVTAPGPVITRRVVPIRASDQLPPAQVVYALGPGGSHA